MSDCKSCNKPKTRSRKKRKFCSECGRALTANAESTPQQEESSSILLRSTERIYENLQSVPRNEEARSTAHRTQAAHNLSDTEVSNLRRSLIFEPAQRHGDWVIENPALE